MSNLWEETIEFLKENDKTFEDVLFIQGEDFKVTKRKLRRYTKEKLKIDNTYDYADSCYRHYFLGFYGDIKPKFMRSKFDEVSKEVEGIDNDW